MQENNIIVLNMDRDDLEYIINNLEDFDDFWNENLLKSEFENENTTCIVAKINKEVIGFASLWEPPFEIHINNIVVRKDMRNRNIGSLIMEELLSISKKKGKEELTLEVSEKNIPAIKLYEKFGFEKIGVRKKYYNNTYDAIIMNKKLN